MAHSTQFILRLRVKTGSEHEAHVEKFLAAVAKHRGGQLSRIVTDERADHSLHVSRRTIVKDGRAL